MSNLEIILVSVIFVLVICLAVSIILVFDTKADKKTKIMLSKRSEDMWKEFYQDTLDTNKNIRKRTNISREDQTFLNTLISRRMIEIDRELKELRNKKISDSITYGGVNVTLRTISLLEKELKQLNRFQKNHIMVRYETITKNINTGERQ